MSVLLAQCGGLKVEPTEIEADVWRGRLLGHNLSVVFCCSVLWIHYWRSVCSGHVTANAAKSCTELVVTKHSLTETLLWPLTRFV